jgi:predicted nuclease of predicted toxin-antitoxin system
MRILADENIPAFLVKALRAEGWDVNWISEIASSASDDVVIEMAKATNRILITVDVELASRSLLELQSNLPILLLRTGDMDTVELARLVMQTLKRGTDWQEPYTVLTPQKLRVRRMLWTVG